MSCDCGCTNTTVNCNCPDPDNINAARLDNIISADFGAGEDIYNGGSGYTYTLYTNTTSGNQIVYIQTNCQISCTTTHNITSQYKLNASNTGVTQEQTSANTKIDHTHFLIATTVPPSGVVTINLLSNNSNGKALWLEAFIYKYDV